MFGIGGPELFVIVIIALLFVGPDKLPQVAKTVGTGLRDLRRMANLTQTELQNAMQDLAREVERLPEAQAKAELDAKLNALPEHDEESIDKAPKPRPTHVPPPTDGETLAVVQKRVPPIEVTRHVGPPTPGFVVKPAEGARARGEAVPDAEAAPATAPSPDTANAPPAEDPPAA